MLRILRLIPALGVFSVALAGPAEDIKTFHDAFAKLKLAGKPDGAAKLLSLTLTPDFLHMGLNGMRMNRSQYIEQVKKQLAASKYSKCSYKFTPLVKTAGGLSLTATMTYSMKSKGPDGKMHTFSGTADVDQVWTLIGKTPKCRRMRMRQTITSVDGKPPVRQGGGPRVAARAI